MKQFLRAFIKSLAIAILCLVVCIGLVSLGYRYRRRSTGLIPDGVYRIHSISIGSAVITKDHTIRQVEQILERELPREEFHFYEEDAHSNLALRFVTDLLRISDYFAVTGDVLRIRSNVISFWETRFHRLGDRDEDDWHLINIRESQSFLRTFFGIGNQILPYVHYRGGMIRASVILWWDYFGGNHFYHCYYFKVAS